MKRNFLLTVALLAISLCAMAQSKKDHNKQCDIVDSYLLEERFDEAESVVDSMLRLYPQNADMLYYKAICHSNRYELDEALEGYTRAIECHNRKSRCSRALLYFNCAAVYYEWGWFERAIEEFTSALSVVGKDDDAMRSSILQYRAESYYFLKDYDNAMSDLMQIVFAVDDSMVDATRALAGLCDISNKIGEYEETVIYANELIARGDYLFIAYRELVRAYYELGDIHKSIDSAIEMVVESFGDSSEVFVRWLFLHDMEYARSAIYRRIEADVELNDIWVHIGLLDYVNDYEIILALLPLLAGQTEDGLVSYWMYEYSAKLGRFDDAVEYLKESLLATSDVERKLLITAKLCNCYYELGEYEQANEYVMNALDWDVDSATAYGIKGGLYDLIDDVDSAVECFKKALELDDEMPAIHLTLGQIYLSQGDVELANREFERVLELDVDLSEGSLYHQALYHLGRYDEVKECIYYLIEEEPYNPEVRYECAALLALMGETELALDTLKAALEFGYCKINTLKSDSDFDSIRDMEAFKELVNSYSE